LKSLSLYFILISFLILIYFLNPVSAITYDDEFIHSDSGTNSFSTNAAAPSTLPYYYINSVQINDITTMSGMTYMDFRLTNGWLYNPGGLSYDYNNVDLYIGGDKVGTGIYGFNQGPTFTWIQLWIYDFDVSSYSGAQIISLSGNSISLSTTFSSKFVYPSSMLSGNDKVHFRTSNGKWPFDNSRLYTTVYSYTQTFPFNYTNINDVYSMEMERDAVQTSMVDVTILGSKVVDETVLKTTDFMYVNTTGSTWTVTNENIFGNIQEKVLYFDGSETTATISLNQTEFTSPDPVGVIYDIINLDLTNYEYWIVVIGDNGEIPHYVSNDFYDITTSTGQDNFTISPGTLSLPFNMQAELRTYDKRTGTFNTLAVSEILSYNPESIAPGKIWTDKDNYNISEIFYIQIDTNYNTVQIELISSDFYDLRTMEGPGFNYLGYLFNDPHNFTAYLIENGIKTNSTDFSVSADSPFLNIHVDTVPVNQGFCFSYYTDNTSDTITGYRPDGSIFYGPTTNLKTLEKVDICGPSSPSPAGIYTMSLLHDGADYYNDTIVMSSANEYIYFESSKYETGDRMIIHYYIMDRRQRIRLSDSVGTAVVTWTCDAFYITPNMGNSLWFSLIDNNEYGLNMNASIDAGTFRTGNWKVEIIGIDGKPLTDYDTYDYTTVNKKIDTSEDQTTAFILLIFSPEGLFLILTSVLMLAGLVAAKHPAGGAAGAAVGVGFGVFFGVLPVWMLLLMVILLVVLAGVGTAVYFKGK
jgi:hypothetical protein